MADTHNLGRRVSGNWGAMHPAGSGTIIGWDATKGHLIQWDDQYPYHTTWSEVHPHGYKSANGSSVGVTLTA